MNLSHEPTRGRHLPRPPGKRTHRNTVRDSSSGPDRKGPLRYTTAVLAHRALREQRQRVTGCGRCHVSPPRRRAIPGSVCCKSSSPRRRGCPELSLWSGPAADAENPGKLLVGHHIDQPAIHVLDGVRRQVPRDRDSVGLPRALGCQPKHLPRTWSPWVARRPSAAVGLRVRDRQRPCRLGVIGIGVAPEGHLHTEHAVLKCALCDRRSHGSGLGGLYDGGHGADQLPESLGCRGFAGDVDADLRPGEDESPQRLGGRGDRDVGRCGRGFRGE